MVARKLPKTKRCSKCHRRKLLKFFYPYRGKNKSSYKRQGYCIACKRKTFKVWWVTDPERNLEYNRDFRLRNKEYIKKYGHPILEHPSKRVCPKCKILRSIYDFHISIETRRGRCGYCKYCRAKARHRYYWKNREILVMRKRLKLQSGYGDRTDAKSREIRLTTHRSHRWMWK